MTYSVQNNDDGTSNVRFNFTMNVMMWIESPFWSSGSPSEHIEHESGHLIQWAILYQDRKAFLEGIESFPVQKGGDPDHYAKRAMESVFRMDIKRFSTETHNKDVNHWAFKNKNRAIPTLGKGVLRYNPE